MRKKLLTAIIYSLIATTHVTITQAEDLISRWTFNSNPPDNKTPTGSLAPAFGRGRLALIGGVTGAFTAGDPSDTSPDNSGLRTSSYPPQGTLSRTAGVEFRVSTRGFYNISVSMKIMATSTASRIARLQYTTDGSNYIDSLLMPIGPANVFVRATNSFHLEWRCNDNTNFGFRVLTEFLYVDPIGTNYETSTIYPYSPDGVIRFDEVEVWGLPLNFDPIPQASYPQDVTTQENEPVNDMRFDVADELTPVSDIIVELNSSNELLLPRENISLVGNSTNRALTLIPAENRTGVSTVSINVINQGGRTITRSFRLFVVPRGNPPAVNAISNQVTTMNVPISVPFTINPWTENTTGPYFIAEASNTPLAPRRNMKITGEGTNWMLHITPATNQMGTSLITVHLSNGHRMASNRFSLTVLPTTELFVCETFDYGTGPLVTNSHHLWLTHSGTAGQIPVIESRAWLVSNQSEDVNIPLRGGPFTTGSNRVLYAGFNVALRSLPASSQFFAHYNANSFRGRVFTSTNGAAPDRYRIGVANSTTMTTNFPLDLEINTGYRVVTRYEVATGNTTLWLDPTTESDPSITAIDLASPTTIGAYAFRQNAGIGTMTVDELKVGTSFAEVAARTRPSLSILSGSHIAEISWHSDVSGFVLEESDSLVAPTWRPVEGDPSLLNHGRWALYSFYSIGNRFFRLRQTNGIPVR